MTEIEMYDRSVFKYLSSIVHSSRIVYSPTSLAIRTITQRAEFRDNIPLNFISFYRDPNFDIDANRYNFPATYRGDIVSRRLYEEAGKKKLDVETVQNLPVNLRYQIDIWSAKNSTVQEVSLALITKLYMQEQVLKVDLEPRKDDHEARMHFTDIEWYDNSDLESETEVGKLYRHTISFTIDSRITLSSEYTTKPFCDGDCKIPVEIYE